VVDCVQYQIQFCSAHPSCRAPGPQRHFSERTARLPQDRQRRKPHWRGRIHHAMKAGKPLDQQRETGQSAAAAPSAMEASWIAKPLPHVPHRPGQSTPASAGCCLQANRRHTIRVLAVAPHPDRAAYGHRPKPGTYALGSPLKTGVTTPHFTSRPSFQPQPLKRDASRTAGMAPSFSKPICSRHLEPARPSEKPLQIKGSERCQAAGRPSPPENPAQSRTQRNAAAVGSVAAPVLLACVVHTTPAGRVTGQAEKPASDLRAQRSVSTACCS